jgi:hypothetical protein
VGCNVFTNFAPLLPTRTHLHLLTLSLILSIYPSTAAAQAATTTTATAPLTTSTGSGSGVAIRVPVDGVPNSSYGSCNTSMIAPFLHTLAQTPQPVQLSMSMCAVSDRVIALTGHTLTHNPHPVHNDSSILYFISSVLLRHSQNTTFCKFLALLSNLNDKLSLFFVESLILRQPVYHILSFRFSISSIICPSIREAITI